MPAREKPECRCRCWLGGALVGGRKHIERARVATKRFTRGNSVVERYCRDLRGLAWQGLGGLSKAMWERLGAAGAGHMRGTRLVVGGVGKLGITKQRQAHRQAAKAPSGLPLRAARASGPSNDGRPSKDRRPSRDRQPSRDRRASPASAGSRLSKMGRRLVEPLAEPPGVAGSEESAAGGRGGWGVGQAARWAQQTEGSGTAAARWSCRLSRHSQAHAPHSPTRRCGSAPT